VHITQDELTESLYILNIINGKTYSQRINFLSFQSIRTSGISVTRLKEFYCMYILRLNFKVNSGSKEK